MANKKLPVFKTDEEEARWFAEHDDELDQYFGEPKMVTREEAEQLGMLPPRKPSEAIKLRMAIDDLALAKEMAQQKGIPYQTFLKSLIHEGLLREKNRTA